MHGYQLLPKRRSVQSCSRNNTDKVIYMTVQEQIDTYIAGQPEPKRSDMQSLHLLTLQVSQACKLWFNDGKNAEGKTIAKRYKQ